MNVQIAVSFVVFRPSRAKDRYLRNDRLLLGIKRYWYSRPLRLIIDSNVQLYQRRSI